MGRSLAILDGNCYIHSGEANWSRNFNYLGFPTGGIYQLMTKVVRLFTQCIDFAVVFDSPSFRKSIDADYKSSRKVDPKIIAQINALKPCLVRAGVNVLQVNEFEGDDLIANIVESNPNRDITIYTCDYDIAQNVCQNVSICGCKTGFPSITKTNFRATMRMSKAIKKEVPYNLLAMYKVVFGDLSDNYSGVGAEAEKVWQVFMKIWERDFDSKDKSLIVTKSFCEKFINATAKFYTEDTLRALRNNVSLVFPRMLTEEEIKGNSLSLTSFNNINKSALADVCHLFGLKKAYYSLQHSEDYPLTQKEKDWLLDRTRRYKQKVDAINEDVDMHGSATYSGSEVIDSEDEDFNNDFEEVADGSNVGGF